MNWNNKNIKFGQCWWMSGIQGNPGHKIPWTQISELQWRKILISYSTTIPLLPLNKSRKKHFRICHLTRVLCKAWKCKRGMYFTFLSTIILYLRPLIVQIQKLLRLILLSSCFIYAMLTLFNVLMIYFKYHFLLYEPIYPFSNKTQKYSLTVF